MELMVVMIIIGILATMGLPYFGVYLLKGDLGKAQPYLLQIASKERIFRTRTGKYYHSSAKKEQDFEDVLGVDLRDAGDFCFMVVCKATTDTTCTTQSDAGNSTTSSGGYIASKEGGDPDIEFEVWAVLRSSTATSVSGGPNGSCKVADDKLDPTGWVQSSGRGKQGHVVVLRYPPPPDGVDNTSGHDGKKFVWERGLSLTDALVED